MMTLQKFKPLICGTYIFTCALPLNLDPYRTCEYQCEYCFMKNRKIGAYHKKHVIPDIDWLRRKFKKIYDDKNINKNSLIDMMLKNRIDLHCGTKTDPFQPREKRDQHTKKIVDLCNTYNQHIIFTTKSDTYHDVQVNPEKHCFQFSITNHYNDRYLEPHVPQFEKRVRFYNRLKDEGFKVGIRFEPFLPNVTDVKKVLSYFDEPDVVHIAKLNLLPQTDHTELIRYLGCSPKQFVTHGKTHMRLGLLYDLYLRDVFEWLESEGYPFSARTAMFGNQNCCCGDALVHKCNTFDPVHLYRKYGGWWSLEDALSEMGEYRGCDMRNLFTSNRRGECRTCEDFYRDRWCKRTSKFTPMFMGEVPSSSQSTLNKYF